MVSIFKKYYCIMKHNTNMNLDALHKVIPIDYKYIDQSIYFLGLIYILDILLISYVSLVFVLVCSIFA